MKTSVNKIFAFLISITLSFFLAACCLKVPALTAAISARGNLNLLTYTVFVLVFIFSFMIIYGILNHFQRAASAKASAFSILFTGILLIGSTLFLLAMLYLEGNVYGGVSDRYIWHTLPFSLVVICMAAELIFFFLCFHDTSVSLPKAALYSLYAMLTLLVAWSFYTPDTFVRGYSDRLHANAYYNSIYNVLHGAPYTADTTSIYGHYAILFRWPLKLLGGDYIDFILLIVLLGAVCFLALFLALHFLVPDNLLRVLGAVAMTLPILTMRGGYYWQLWPHRILFMSLLILYAAIGVRFHLTGHIYCIIGYLLSLLAIIWNTECGIFCAVSWAAFWILKYCCERRWHWGKVFSHGLLHICAVIVCFAGAYGVVNLYNLIHGGTYNSLKDFLFPLMTSAYMDDLLRLELPDFPSAYMPVLALLCLCIAWGLSHMNLFHKNKERNLSRIPLICFVFSTAVLSLGMITYFINRAAYHNLDIIHLPAILLICILSQRGMDFIRTFRLKKYKNATTSQLFQGAFTALNLALLLVLTTGTVIQYGYNADYKKQFDNRQGLHDFAAHIAANIPEDTYAFGIGVAEIYSILRWDTQVYTLDFADISVYPSAADYVLTDMKNKNVDDFLLGEQTIKKLKTYAPEQYQWVRENYKLSQEFEFEGAVFKYYIKK